MSWYELLLTLHILAAALWFGSGLAIAVVSYRMLATGDAAFGGFVRHATWWAGRAHPAAGVVIVLAGFAMLADADISLGETWVSLALGGWVVLMALGGALVGPTAGRLDAAVAGGGGGALTSDARSIADRLLLITRVELAVLVLVIVIMVAKPG